MVSENDHAPWCPRCERDLEIFPPDPSLGWAKRRLAVWDTKLGFSLNRRLFKELSAQQVRRPRVTFSFFVVFLLSMALLAGLVAAVVGGVWLIVHGTALTKASGALLVLVAYLLRPRLGRLKPWRDDYDEVTRAQAPQLFGFLDRAADTLGAKRIQRLFLSHEWNASVSKVGFRRTRVMMLGVPLWVCLRPQERVFVVGHELGHFINNDVRRGLLTAPACTVFAELADLVQPVPTSEDDILTLVVKVFRVPFQLALFYLLIGIHLAVTMIAMRDAHRAEYWADARALDLAGGNAVSALDMLAETFSGIIGSRARAGLGYEGWAEAVEQTRAQRDGRLVRLRQLSQRVDASPLLSHPPAGLRHRMAVSQRFEDPKLVLTAAEAAAIDAELRRFEARYSTAIAHAW